MWVVECLLILVRGLVRRLLRGGMFGVVGELGFVVELDGGKAGGLVYV